MKKIDRLIAAWMHDEATDEQVKQLFEWVRENPNNAQEFARSTSLHSDLRSHFSNIRSLKEVGEEPFLVQAPVRPAARSSQRFLWYISAGAAACVMLLVGIGMLLVHVDNNNPGNNITESSRTTRPFVTVAQVDDAVWDRKISLTSGDRIASETLFLRSGMAKLLFDDGVEVTLRGPAQFDLISRGSTKLTLGALTATVPPGAEFFRVETPSAEVFDLGTAFGVNVSESGDARISVFDGAVHVFPMTGGLGQMLAAGEEIQVAVNGDARPLKFDSLPFEDLWPVSWGITNATGAVRFASPWPGSLNTKQSDTEIFVQPEGYATILSQPLNVDVTGAGEVSRMSQFDATDLSSGSRVRSFLLHFSPETDGQNRGRIIGDISFNRPVTGLILSEELLAASNARFRSSVTSGNSQALELTEDSAGDTVTLSSDQRTVSLDLRAGGRDARQLRVIVDDSYAELEEVRLAIAGIGAADSESDTATSAHGKDGPDDQSVADRPGSPMGFRPPIAPGVIRFFRARDRNGDRRISRDEMPEPMRRMMPRIDTDGDGFLTPNEMNNGRMRHGPGMR